MQLDSFQRRLSNNVPMSQATARFLMWCQLTHIPLLGWGTQVLCSGPSQRIKPPSKWAFRGNCKNQKLKKSLKDHVQCPCAKRKSRPYLKTFPHQLYFLLIVFTLPPSVELYRAIDIVIDMCAVQVVSQTWNSIFKFTRPLSLQTNLHLLLVCSAVVASIAVDLQQVDQNLSVWTMKIL